MSPPARMRLFAAVVPSPAVRDAIATRIAAPQALQSEARWIAPEKLHITVQFFGSVPVEQLAALRVACERAASAVAPFALSIAGGGAFPSVSRARVLWLGVQTGRQALVQLSAALANATAELGFAAEARDYSPHLTLARFKLPTHVAPWVEQLRDLELGCSIEALSLLHSQPGPGGVRYQTLAQFALVRH